MSEIRINTEGLIPGSGSIVLPLSEGRTILCSGCKQPIHDHGLNASVRIEEGPSSVLHLVVDCEICGKYTGPPIIKTIS